MSVPVFVGSTFKDLEPYRAAVRDSLHRLEAVVRGMEYFGSMPETPKDECLRIVRTCRLYIGVFAMRYGSRDSVTGKSLTQLEYEEAQRIHLPSLIYMIDEDRQPILPRFVDTGDEAALLRSFKETLRARHVVSLFTTPDDLAIKVTRDVPQIASRSGFEVRPGELTRIAARIPRVAWLTDERFQFLKKELGAAANPISSDAVLREALEFILAGDNMAATFLLARGTPMTADDAIDCLMAMDKVLKAIIKRGAQTLTAEREARTASAVAPHPLANEP